jgi:hypothetical protein
VDATIIGGALMKHRIRIARAIDDSDQPHVFLETESDTFFEINLPPADVESITPDMVESFVGRVHPKTGIVYLCYADRAFRIGLVKDWHEAGIVETNL